MINKQGQNFHNSKIVLEFFGFFNKKFMEFISYPSAFLNQAMQYDSTELAFLFVPFYSQMGFGGITSFVHSPADLLEIEF